MTDLMNTTRMPGLIILDDGQMGRMQTQAAHRAGYTPFVWSADANSPAAQVSNCRIPLAFEADSVSCMDDEARKSVGVLCGWENVPAELAQKLGEIGVPVHSLPQVLKVAQSRRAEKNRAAELDIPTAKCISFDTLGTTGTPFDSIDWQDWPYDTIVKTDNGGYDGKGQWSFSDHDDLVDHSWPTGKAFMIEERVDLDFECSVMVARSVGGTIQVSPAVHNVHRNGILHHSFWYPGIISSEVEEKVRSYARKIAESFDLVGLLCCEFFVTKDGRVLFNEMACRPHNSFHDTIDACDFSQFDLYVQAVTGEPLMHMSFTKPWVMVNLLGEAITKRYDFIQGGFAWHDYGKAEVKDGRKMGHATLVLDPRTEEPADEIADAVEYAVAA